MKYKLRNSKRGFTLVELIVVLTILSVLAAMLIPALQGYIEKSLETADVLHVREAYMEVLTASLTNDTENQVKTVNLKQKQDDWQSMDPITIAGITHYKKDGDTANWKGIPTAGGVCEVSYDATVGVVFTWSGSSGNNTKVEINFEENLHGILDKTELLKNDLKTGRYEIDSTCTNSTMVPKVKSQIGENSLLKHGTWAYGRVITPNNTQYLFWTSLDTATVGPNQKIPVIISIEGGGFYISETTTATKQKGSDSYTAIMGAIYNGYGLENYTRNRNKYDTLEEAYAAYSKLVNKKYPDYKGTLPK